MGRKHSKQDILAAGVQVAREQGLSQLSFGRVAKVVGISDRTVVYYFPTKEALVSEVMVAIGGDMQSGLASAFQGQAADHLALCRAAWPVLATPELDATFALFFEASGLAAAGRSPFDRLVPGMIHAWSDWLMQFLDGAEEDRRREADATIALIDGLLFCRQTAGPEAAERAAIGLGVIEGEL